MSKELVERPAEPNDVAEPDEEEQNSIVLALGDETHTLGNALRDVMWSHPHVQLASYTQEHPSASEIIVRCQTTGVIPAEQAVVEALHMTKEILTHIGATMEDAVARWEQEHGPVGSSSKPKQPRQPRQGAAQAPPPEGDEDMEEAG